MKAVARRLASRWRRSWSRRALLLLALVATMPVVAEQVVASGDSPVRAEFGSETERYPHGVLGDTIEYGSLHLEFPDGRVETFVLPDHLVFEDIKPRLADVDRDGVLEVVVVESSASAGARLAIYGHRGRIAATPFIGTRFRWLAPVGVADLDDDGFVELSYIDRPHLAKRLKIWRFRNGRLEHVATAPGLTNHRIGENFISGGLRDCGRGPEVITADANWSNVMVSRLVRGKIDTRVVSRFKDAQSLEDALNCVFE